MLNLKSDVKLPPRWECHCPQNTGGLYRLCPLCEVDYAAWALEFAQANFAQAEAALVAPRV